MLIFPKPSRRLACVLGLPIMLAWQAAAADDVLETIQEGVQLYQEGDFSEAINSLNYAVQLIQQMKGATLTSFLPEPRPGWSAEEASSETAGAAMFGGGVTARRTYRNEQAQVEIQIITDSPMLQGMMMMFTNPMFATAEGGKLERIGRQKAIVKHDPVSGEGSVTAVVANRFLVTVEGSSASKEDLIGFAEAIDFQGLAKLP